MQALYSVISRGTESLVYNQRVPVTEHQRRYSVPAVAVIPVPPTVPPARAILAANMETAVNGVWDAQPAVAQRLGFAFSTEPDIAGCDLVINASGQPAGLATALALAGAEARVIELSWYGDQPVQVPLGQAFHPGRLTLKSSQVGQLLAERRPRWDHRRRLALVVHRPPARGFSELSGGSAGDGGACHHFRLGCSRGRRRESAAMRCRCPVRSWPWATCVHICCDFSIGTLCTKL
ncbi:hypothetical protein [uncultured Marinobacter sp.]|uniref:hypothetical protein n=1 Tax=uncultured Marinobacter sp. TaxID=187379 RepID=UPI002582B523|nr:hypothetical protein [uncultured Marinobacter sp.]